MQTIGRVYLFFKHFDYYYIFYIPVKTRPKISAIVVILDQLTVVDVELHPNPNSISSATKSEQSDNNASISNGALPSVNVKVKRLDK